MEDRVKDQSNKDPDAALNAQHPSPVSHLPSPISGAKRLSSISGAKRIFSLSLRSILRERVAVSMLGLLLLVLLLLPAGLKSDGTLEGAVRMQIRYSLGFSFALLAGMTLWVSCASIATDLSNKRLQMVLTKPVTRAAIWWGKWLSVVTLVTALGLLCGGVTLFRVHRIIAEADLSEEERNQVSTRIVTARRAVDLPVMDFTAEAADLYEKQLAAGAIPEQAPKEDILKQMERYVRVERHAVDAGTSASWTFSISPALKEGESLQLMYRYDGNSMSGGKQSGEWSVSDDLGLSKMTFPVEQTPQGEHLIPFTVPVGLEGAEALVFSFSNPDPDNAKVFFQVDRGIRLFRAGGSFSPNLFRAVILLTGLLAILAAIGVSTGSIFSLPVACYSASVVLLVQAFSGVVSDMVDQGLPADLAESPWIWQRLMELRQMVYQLLLRIIQPMQVENPLTRVAEGVLIPNSEVFAVLMFRFMPVVLIAAVIGIFLFSRREVGGAS